MKKISGSELSLLVQPLVSQESFSDVVSASASTLFPWGEIIAKVYLIGVGIVLFVFIYAFLRIIFMLYTEKRIRKGKFTLILTERLVSSFSWMKYVIIPSKDWKEHGMEIFQHEKAHVLLKHSWDLLFLQICMVLYWFNPVIWFIRRELQDLHEFEADEYVIRKGADRKEYQLLLIKKAVGIQRFVFITNSFNDSKLKKRIYMMQKKRSTNRNYMKYLFILPLCVVAVTLLARPEVTLTMDKVSKIKVTGNSPGKGITITGYPENDSISIRGYSQAGVEIRISNELGLTPSLIFLDGKEITKKELDELDPEQLESIEVLLDASSAVGIYGEKGINGVIHVKSKSASGLQLTSDNENPEITKNQILTDFRPENVSKNLLIFIDGVEVASEELVKYDSKEMKSVSILTDKDAEIYGEKAKDGVIIITSKNKEE